jgi:hypothetical protein
MKWRKNKKKQPIPSKNESCRMNNSLCGDYFRRLQLTVMFTGKLPEMENSTTEPKRFLIHFGKLHAISIEKSFPFWIT